MNKQEFDCILVLGDSTTSSQLTPWVVERVEVACKLHAKQKANTIIVSGRGNQEESEAHMMSKYLIGKGVLPKQIISEDESSNPLEGLLFSANIMHKKKWRRDLIITNKVQKNQIQTLANHVFDEHHYVKIKGVKNKGFNKDQLKKRKLYEKKLTIYLKNNVFNQMQRANTGELKDFLYNSKNTAHQNYKTFIAKLNKELNKENWLFKAEQ